MINAAGAPHDQLLRAEGFLALSHYGSEFLGLRTNEIASLLGAIRKLPIKKCISKSVLCTLRS